MAAAADNPLAAALLGATALAILASAMCEQAQAPLLLRDFSTIDVSDVRARLARDESLALYLVNEQRVPLFTAPIEDEIAVPAMARSVRVAIAPSHRSDDALPALVIDGRLVPNEALADHQSARNAQAFIVRRASLTIEQVAGASIAVRLGPSPYDIGAARPDDVFTEPQFRGAIAMKRVEGGGVVTFE